MSPWDILAWVTSFGLAAIIVLVVILLTVFAVTKFGRLMARRKDVS